MDIYGGYIGRIEINTSPVSGIAITGTEALISIDH
jgi:hypothetical protein